MLRRRITRGGVRTYYHITPGGLHHEAATAAAVEAVLRQPGLHHGTPCQGQGQGQGQGQDQVNMKHDDEGCQRGISSVSWQTNFGRRQPASKRVSGVAVALFSITELLCVKETVYY